MAFGPLCIPPSATGSQEQRPQEAQTLQNFIKNRSPFSIYTFGHLTPLVVTMPPFQSSTAQQSQDRLYIFKKVSKMQISSSRWRVKNNIYIFTYIFFLSWSKNYLRELWTAWVYVISSEGQSMPEILIQQTCVCSWQSPRQKVSTFSPGGYIWLALFWLTGSSNFPPLVGSPDWARNCQKIFIARALALYRLLVVTFVLFYFVILIELRTKYYFFMS